MSDTELSISRRIAAPSRAVWAAWSDPRLIEEWFCPKPWRAEVVRFDMQPGGAFVTRMRGPEGESQHSAGCFLEVVPETRIVFTSVLGEGWQPLIASNKGCDMPMTAIITLEPDGDGTRYSARVLHANAEDTRKHVEMGFEPGWAAVIAQLEAVAQLLAAKRG